MKHAVSRPTPAFASASGALEIHQIPVWEDNLVWLAVCTPSKTAAVVDGPPEAGTVLEYCERHGFTLTTVLNTHTHMDHIGINQDLAERGLLAGMRVVGAKKMSAQVPGLTEAVSDGDTVKLGTIEGRVMLTEGHLDGHISFLFEDVLFCGDTLFAGGCGRLFDGPPKKMFDSLSRLTELDGKTRVCCAHEYTQDNLRFAWSVEPENEALAARIKAVWKIRSEGGSSVPSTVADERATNPFVRWASADLVRHVRAAMPDAPMGSPEQIFTATRALKDQGLYKAAGDTPLPL